VSADVGDSRVEIKFKVGLIFDGDAVSFGET